MLIRSLPELVSLWFNVERELKAGRPIGLDFETFGQSILKLKGKGSSKSAPNPYSHRLCGVSVCFLKDAAGGAARDNLVYVYVPTDDHARDASGFQGLPRDKVVRFVARIVGSAAASKSRSWWHNVKYDSQIMLNEGLAIPPSEVWADSMVAAWLCGWRLGKKGGLKLKPLAESKGWTGLDSFDGVAKGRQFSELTAEEAEPYAAVDAALTLWLGELAYKRLQEHDLVRHFHDLDMPLVEVTRACEAWGSGLDREKLAANCALWEREAEEIARTFYELTKCVVDVPTKVREPKPCDGCEGAAGGCTSPQCVGGIVHYKNGKPKYHSVMRPVKAELGARVGNDRDVSRWCYEHLGWWPTGGLERNGDGEWPVGHEIIEEFAVYEGRGGEAARMRLRFQLLNKLVGTYAKPMRALADQYADGRLHPSCHLTGTDCMIAGSPVLTARGYLPVEKVRRGDTVLTHTGVPSVVEGTSTHDPSPIYRVVLSNGTTLATTGNHPYRVRAGWVPAWNLVEGDEVDVHGGPEFWADVPGWVGEFRVSSWGRVRSVLTDRFIKPSPCGRYGHLKITCYRGDQSRALGNKQDFPLHRLVLRAFVGEPLAGEEARHLNGFAWDNTLPNLAWGTSTENKADGKRHGSTSHRTTSRQSKLTATVVAMLRGRVPFRGCQGIWAAECGISRRLVGMVLSGQRWAPEPSGGKRAEFTTATVVRVVCEPPQVSYGLTVTGQHSHVTAGIVTHNTQRFSSSDPNLTNMPNTSIEGKQVRDCLIARDGWSIIVSDYSQVELRIVAHLSLDEALTAIYRERKDVHANTMARLGCARRDAKVTNFATIYKISPKGLAKKQSGLRTAPDGTVSYHEVNPRQARKDITGFFEAYPRVPEYHRKACAFVIKHGYAMTVGGYKRFLDNTLVQQYEYQNGQKVAAGMGLRWDVANQSINTPVQGTGAEFMKRAMLALHRQWKADGTLGVTRAVVTSEHDSLVIEARNDVVEASRADIKRAMENVYPAFRVPLVAEDGVGQSWASAKA